MSRWPLLIFRSVGQRSCLFFICWGRGALVFYKHLYFNFQVRVRAYDNGQPAKDNVTVVTVTIQRNLAAPVINPTFIPARISEYTNLGIPVTRVNATDADPQPPHNTIRYTLYAGSLASEYFFLDDVTGDIYVKKSLTLDAGQNLQYTVGLMLRILSSFIINWITLSSSYWNQYVIL